MITMIETQRTRRSHAFLPPAAELEQIPALYETDHIQAEDKLIPLHYFSAAGDWWVDEIGMEDGEPPRLRLRAAGRLSRGGRVGIHPVGRAGGTERAPRPGDRGTRPLVGAEEVRGD